MISPLFAMFLFLWPSSRQLNMSAGHEVVANVGGGSSQDSAGTHANRPLLSDKAGTARWLAHNTVWATLSTISVRENPGAPFGNIVSFSDGIPGDSTGQLYFLLSPLDASIIDVDQNNSVSLSISATQTNYCQDKNYDAEDPRCARLSLSGILVQVESKEEKSTAKEALFIRHPVMEEWYNNEDEEDMHQFRFWKLQLDGIWFLDSFGGPSHISLEEWERGTDDDQVAFLSPSYTSKSVTGIANQKDFEEEVQLQLPFYSWIATIIVASGVGFVIGGRLASSPLNLQQQFRKIDSSAPPSPMNPQLELELVH
mmetsp:Transcript_20460/g.31048  ORF Transcript_20460/g.31048 Transcript_20460/m.31048 type:complete len:312 (+) Transcript_20460:1-936(+)